MKEKKLTIDAVKSAVAQAKAAPLINAIEVPVAVEPIQRVYRLAREGGFGNLRVEEISLQGDRIIGRHFVSERDAKPFALARLMNLVEDQVRVDYK